MSEISAVESTNYIYAEFSVLKVSLPNFCWLLETKYVNISIRIVKMEREVYADAGPCSLSRLKCNSAIFSKLEPQDWGRSINKVTCSVWFMFNKICFLSRLVYSG